MKEGMRSQGAFEYILLLGGVLLIVVVAVIILRGSVLNQSNQQIGGNVNVYTFLTCIPQYIAKPGSVIAHWKFDEGSGNVAKDSSPAKRNGRLCNFNYDSSSGWVSGKNGNALRFDGSNDFISGDCGPTGINLPLSALTPNQLTITAWIRTTSTATQDIITKNGPFFFSIANGRAGNPWNAIWRPGEWTGVQGTSNIATGEWTHIAMVYYSPGSVKIYVNGNLEATAPKIGNLDGDGCVEIGRGNNFICGSGGQTSELFNGALDDLVVYNRSLSQNEIC